MKLTINELTKYSQAHFNKYVHIIHNDHRPQMISTGIQVKKNIVAIQDLLMWALNCIITIKTVVNTAMTA